MWLAELARRRALETPTRLAYRWLDRNAAEPATLTYAELDRRASAIGRAIAARTAPRARVALLLPSDLDFVVAMFACMYAGRTVVPGPDPRRRDAAAYTRVRALLCDALPELVIARPELVADLTGANWAASLPPETSCATLEQLSVAADGGGTPGSDDNELTMLQYTSGSTSEPKGVMITESALQTNLRHIRERFENSEASIGVTWLPMHHDMGLIGCVLEPMHSGFPTTLLSPLDFAQRPVRWLQAITQYSATVTGGPTFAYQMCAERIRDNQFQSLDLSSWRVAFVGAERVSASVLRSFVARFSRHGFDERAVLPCYGLAETTLMATSRTRGSGLHVDTSESQRVSCGAPLAGHELRIVDAVSGEPCPNGEIGEVWLRGPSVAAGYFRKSELSAQTFGSTLGGLGTYLRTGDLGFLRDGELYLTGRLKETIIVRGVKHAPEDFEATVAASHPCFANAPSAAFACDAGGDESVVIACEVRRGAWSEVELEAATATAFEAVVRIHDVRPRAIVLVRPGALPRTTSGKLQRTSCGALFERGALGVS